jgi:hypothetical protein
MTYEFYKVMHFLGIVMLFTALGGSVLHVINGGSKATNVARPLVGALHGIALALILIGGFGMMARLGYMTAWPGWIHGKLAAWVALPALGMVAQKKPQHARTVLVLILVVGLFAAWMAIYKPV